MGRGNLLTTMINKRMKAGTVVARVMYQPSMGPQERDWVVVPAVEAVSTEEDPTKERQGPSTHP